MSTALTRLALVLGAALAIAACRDASIVAPEQDARQATGLSKRLLGNPIINITAGEYHTCIRYYLGQTYCWGLNDDGELGIGASPASCTVSGSGLGLGHGGSPPLYGCATTPVAIAGFNFGAVSAGMNHTCAIRSPGNTVWCWGRNNGFQLGTGTNTSSTTPVQIASSSAFSSIAAGMRESCGTVDGSWPQGSLVCWGENHSGTQPYFFTPTVIMPPMGVSENFHLVGLGWGTVCVYWFDNSTTSPYCMGDNIYGKAGADPQWGAVGLTQVAGVAPAGAPSVGLWSSCVDVVGGGVACWGATNAGQLGNTQAGKSSWTPVNVASPVPLHGVVVAGFYACALDASGNMWCWGSHSFDGTSTTDPIIVASGHTFISLAAGDQHVCAIGTDKHVWCWGDDTLGQLGDGRPGTKASAMQPVQVSGT